MNARGSWHLLLIAAGLAALLVAAVVMLRPAPVVERLVAPVWSELAPPLDAAPREWSFIVIHHSASRIDSIASIDREHRKRSYDGIGYHFVIGNGRSPRSGSTLGDGAIASTPRWWAQRPGAHAGSATTQSPYNEHGIGICLIGDFTREDPTPAQRQALGRLCVALMGALPAIRAEQVLRHGELPGKATLCPGQRLDVDALRDELAAHLRAMHPQMQGSPSGMTRPPALAPPALAPGASSGLASP